ncbi:DNA (cytosine-5-)-methyltransferase, partial [Salmonella enterica subsp. enterica]|nr:DNA (cytosine-5-)-methyltransferase [Salmonella enterica subsp. enterica]EAR9839028.1 DNA (cytosine-5-)-methyltransferase [Salmonella enterica]EGM3887560.1 DNA (cytosine-5-)-methyltransferase [Salmonella enterica subsp. enterica serovar Typhimurium]MCY5688392.1 DNA cytosine methyltransferase [Salmonella enterica subsp. enterica serovar 1,4,[5],12:i:-]HAS9035679.1 DNA (cytosine-5-)-methyltransferase [Salmonella enterica subsp. enterica serovar 4,12:i:-]
MYNDRTEPAITALLNDETPSSIHKLLVQVASIYDVKDLAAQLNAATGSDWSRASLIRQIKGSVNECRITQEEYHYLRSLLPSRPADYDQKFFRFIDLFAGIGGLRSGFDAIGGKCVFTSEWNQFSRRTYSANWYCDETEHYFNSDIRDITLSNLPDVSDDQAYASIDASIPDHDVLLAG